MESLSKRFNPNTCRWRHLRDSRYAFGFNASAAKVVLSIYHIHNCMLSIRRNATVRMRGQKQSEGGQAESAVLCHCPSTVVNVSTILA